ncbi:hypothetical protein J2Y54_002218 [Sphingomonas sp. BE123]|jgi:hypothetical protein|uniref:hypothetical protein n=1 Tax=unclassified Sphingomonas TaxID=196159 RepID=UPI002864619B|nr:hypothetical protein [Sphingomonas sp. BE123]MDR6852698.1 hypothetical protein [Sphingomonas sp. BE123]
MNAWVRESTVGKALFAIALLLALSLRILLPTGFMPVVNHQGLVVQLCSSVGGETVTIDLGETDPGEQPQYPTAGPCLFAGGSAPGVMAGAELSTIVPVVFGRPPVVGTAIADLTSNRLAAPPPPSQGPPALS